MSIMYCDKHDRQWDSDKLDECPMCENELYEHPNSRSRMKRIAMQSSPTTVQQTTCEFCEPDEYANHAPRCPVFLEGEVAKLRLHLIAKDAKLTDVVERCAKVCDEYARLADEYVAVPSSNALVPIMRAKATTAHILAADIRALSWMAHRRGYMGDRATAGPLGPDDSTSNDDEE